MSAAAFYSSGVTDPAAYAAIAAGFGLWATLMWRGPLKYLALFMCWNLALGLLMIIVLPMNIFVQCTLFALGSFGVSAAAVHVGKEWGLARLKRLADAGRPIREWEWVYTGRQFIWQHPGYRISGGIALTGLVLILSVAVWWFIALQTGHPSSWPWALTALNAFTLLAMVMRWPFAYPLVFICLLPLFPLSAPIMVYWADGTRPNLIYRHRFERLRPEAPDVP
jgi:hypothetical protein